ncbi:MAG: glycosyl transferase family protein [Candidatus Aminicenantales bacterium]
MERWVNYFFPFFRHLLIVLVVVFALGGISDFFVDVYYWLRQLSRKIFKGYLIKPLTLDDLMAVEEKPTALLIPAWNEAGIIKEMLINTLKLINYENYFIFVGVYPNDLETEAEVDEVCKLNSRLIKIVNPKNGPTTKGDNLNAIYQGLLAWEEQRGIKFDVIVLSDAEDIHHPLILKLFNYLMPRFEMIQIPIVPLETKWSQFVGGVYMDEFVEMHLKELIVREKFSRVLPSAGTSTAFWRDRLEEMARLKGGYIFNPQSLAEDYEVGVRMGKMGRKQIILVQFIDRVLPRRSRFGRNIRLKRVKELIATRAFFLTEFRKAMRQRARWIYGIAWQGWKNLGWSSDGRVNFALVRDRLTLISNFIYFWAYLLILYIFFIYMVHLFKPSLTVRPLVRREEIWWILAQIVFFFFAWRLLMRFLFVGKIYGLTQALLSPVRIIVGNILNFASALLALSWIIKAASTRKQREWIKTEHRYPAKNLELFRLKLGDLLLARRVVSVEKLREAIQLQPKINKRLGEILVEKGYLEEEELMKTIAYQLSLPFAEIDPFAVDPVLIRLISKELAHHYRVFPLKIENQILHLATDRVDVDRLKSDLTRKLGVDIKFMLTTSMDLDYAFKRAYCRDYWSIVDVMEIGRKRLGELLLKKEIIRKDDLARALREQKRSYQPLGEILLSRGKISKQVLDHLLQLQADY